MTSTTVGKKVNLQQINVVKLLKLFYDNTKIQLYVTEKRLSNYSKQLLVKYRPITLN